MPVASTIAAVGAGIGVASKAVGLVKGIAGGGGKKGAAGGGGGMMGFTDVGGLSSTGNSAFNFSSTPFEFKESPFKEMASKFPENPAYKLALKADEIFTPKITKVGH